MTHLNNDVLYESNFIQPSIRMAKRSADLVHFTRGRIRLRSNSLKGTQRSMFAFREELESLPTVRSVEINRRTGSFLLAYSPRALEDGEALDLFLVRLTSAFRPINVGPVAVWHAGNSSVRLGLSRKMTAKLRTNMLTTLEKTRGIESIHVDSATGGLGFTYDRDVMARHLRTVHNGLRSGNWASVLRLFL